MTTTAVTGAGTTSAPEEPLDGRPRSLRSAAARSEQLYTLHHRLVSGLCRALLRDAGEAEDAVQQVFLSAHRSLLNGATPREPAAWLATITRNECWARIRGRMREPLPSEAADEIAGRDDPVAEAIRRADLAALWQAIRALPKQQREALLLREFGGLRYDELAAALAVTEPAVESLLFRARARLRAQLETAAAALAPLARLFMSGGGPAVAAKAAALGIGAAAVTGTAVVAPEMLDHRTHGTQSAASRLVRRLHPIPPMALLQTPSDVQRVSVRTSTAETKTTETERHGSGRTTTETEHHDGGRTTTETEHHDGGRTTTEADRRNGGTTTTSSSSGDRGGSGDSGTDGSGRSESSGSGDGDHEQTTTTTTTTVPAIPTLPVTVPVVDASGTDGGGGRDGGSGGGSDGPGG